MTKSRLAVSSLAWARPNCLDRGLRILTEYAIAGLELAPTTVWPDLENATPSAVGALSRQCVAHRLVVPSMQSIHSGLTGASLFGDHDSWQRLYDRTLRVAEIASQLACPTLVFGSPATRDPGKLTGPEAEALAIDRLRTLGDACASHQVTIAFEPNPEIYGCRFGTRTPEVTALIARVGHENIRLQVDAGTVAINMENDTEIIEALPHAQHFHASEPSLMPVKQGPSHVRLDNILSTASYRGWISIEMVRQSDRWDQDLVESIAAVRLDYSASLSQTI